MESRSGVKIRSQDMESWSQDQESRSEVKIRSQDQESRWKPELLFKTGMISLISKTEFIKSWSRLKRVCLVWLLELTEFIVWNILRSRTLGCKDLGIRKSEFVAKTQFLSEIKMSVKYILKSCYWYPLLQFLNLMDLSA